MPQRNGTPPPSATALSDEELLLELQRLQQENSALESQYSQAEETHHRLVERVVHLQQTAEMEEEAIANSLLKRVDQARREVKSYRQQVKSEEDQQALLRTMIEEARSEQAKVENILESEQEFLLNQLQKQLLETTTRKAELEMALSEERRQYLELLHHQLTELTAGSPMMIQASNSMSIGNSSMPCNNSSMPYAPSMQPLPTRVGAFVGHSRSLSDTNATTSFASSACVSLSASLMVDPIPSDTRVGDGGSRVSSTLRSSSVLPASVPKTPDSKRRTIAEVEDEINHLLLEQADYQRRAQSQEMQVQALAEKLREVQQLSFLDRARIVKLKEDLSRAKLDLDLIQQQQGGGSSNNASQRTPSQQGSDDATPSASERATGIGGGPASTGTTPLHHLSLRDRTKELLSTPRIVPMVQHRPRGSSLASDMRSVSPNLNSGYNSGVEQGGMRSDSQTRARETSTRRSNPDDGGAVHQRRRNWSVASTGSNSVVLGDSQLDSLSAGQRTQVGPGESSPVVVGTLASTILPPPVV